MGATVSKSKTRGIDEADALYTPSALVQRAMSQATCDGDDEQTQGTRQQLALLDAYDAKGAFKDPGMRRRLENTRLQLAARLAFRKQPAGGRVA